MHMADALISPAVGGIMWAAAAGTAAYSIRKIQSEIDDKKIPLMGVMGAFVFAAQMINFAIPGTGSSGHIGGGILLSALLGPYAGYLTMASILLIQALFFADGGLLAYGCNVFNLGFFTCFIAYPLIFKWITRKGLSSGRIVTASLISAVVGLQLGSFSVTLQTLFSGKTELPFGTFLLIMQPVHLAVGIVEGLVTAAVVTFVWKARPEIMERTSEGKAFANISLKKVITVLLITTLIIGGILSWFASSNPDGLEWSIFKTAGTRELKTGGQVHDAASGIQNKTSILPDYSLETSENAVKESKDGDTAKPWSSGKAGTSISGLVGGIMTLALAGLAGLIISIVKSRKKKAAV